MTLSTTWLPRYGGFNQDFILLAVLLRCVWLSRTRTLFTFFFVRFFWKAAWLADSVGDMPLFVVGNKADLVTASSGGSGESPQGKRPLSPSGGGSGANARAAREVSVEEARGSFPGRNIFEVSVTTGAGKLLLCEISRWVVVVLTGSDR